jgi:hypothetical protein
MFIYAAQNILITLQEWNLNHNKQITRTMGKISFRLRFHHILKPGATGLRNWHFPCYARYRRSFWRHSGLLYCALMRFPCTSLHVLQVQCGGVSSPKAPCMVSLHKAQVLTWSDECPVICISRQHENRPCNSGPLIRQAVVSHEYFATEPF